MILQYFTLVPSLTFTCKKSSFSLASRHNSGGVWRTSKLCPALATCKLSLKNVFKYIKQIALLKVEQKYYMKRAYEEYEKKKFLVIVESIFFFPGRRGWDTTVAKKATLENTKS